jgi:Protein of unknown function (DUF551).
MENEKEVRTIKQQIQDCQDAAAREWNSAFSYIALRNSVQIGNVNMLHLDGVNIRAMEIYASLRTQQLQEQQWVSVKERLPEVGVDVIATLEHWESKNKRRAALKRVKEDDCDWRTSDDNSEISYSFNVTHWMPLPELPK